MQNHNYTIRPETPADYRTVETLNREAFWNLCVPGCHEHYFVHALRQHPDFVPALDFVLEVDGHIIGSVMYAKAKLIDEANHEKPVLTMGPICIHPEHQRKGYGKALLEYTFEKALQLGYDTVINFGNPDNYVARGYKCSKKYNVCLEGGFYPAVLLVKELRAGALDGRKWTYYPSPAEALCDDTEAVAKFDADFPPKAKQWKPSQEEFYIHSHSVIME